MIEKVTLQLAAGSTFVPEGGQACDELRPKELMLYAAAKCAAMTVLHIMQRERLHPIRLEVSLSGELTEEQASSESIYCSFHVVYNVACPTEEDQAKASRAIRLAHEKYCGMIRMLRMIAPITHEVAIVSVGAPVHP